MDSNKIRLSTTLLILAVICFAASCKTPPEAPPEDSTEWAYIQVDTPPAQTPTQTPTFNQNQITQEYRASTMSDVRIFIEELNGIIRRREYNKWKSALSAEYFAEISSPEYLRATSELPAMKTRQVILRSPEDYFRHVVVPSRSNSRVDDIEFISSNRVKVFTVMLNKAGEEQRLRLYDLERSGNTWKIIN
jgi:hypothetical protein